MLIRRIFRLKPRDSVKYFSDNPELWQKLKDGEEVEVPDEIVKDLVGIEEVKVPKKKAPKKTVEDNETFGGDE